MPFNWLISLIACFMGPNTSVGVTTLLGARPSRGRLVSATRHGSNLVLDIALESIVAGFPRSGSLSINDYFTAEGFIERIEFPDGVVNGANSAPVQNLAIPAINLGTSNGFAAVINARI